MRAFPSKKASSSATKKQVSAGDIFLNFAKEQLGKEWTETMGKDWLEKITRATAKWSPEEAQKFLKFLRNRIGEENTIKRIKSTSYFPYMNYRSFMEKVTLYEQYIGEEGVTSRLQKSFGGFHKGQVNEIRSGVEFLKSYIGEEMTIQKMEQDLQVFSNIKSERLKLVVELIEGYLGKEEMVQRVSEDLRVFARARFDELQPALESTEKLLGGGIQAKEQVKVVLQENLITILTRHPM